MKVLKFGQPLGRIDPRSAMFRFFDSVKDIVVFLGLDGAVEFLSPSTTSVLGYDPAQLVGSSVLRLIHPKDRRRVLAAWRTAITGPHAGPMSPIEYRVVSTSGREVWLESCPVAQFDPDTGSALRVQDVARDISGRKRAEFELALAVEAARDTANAAGEGLVCLNREISAPLVAIAGFTDRLNAMKALPEAARHHARRVAASTQALRSAVSDIVVLSNSDAGRPKLNLRSFDVREFFDETLDLALLPAEERGLLLHLQCSEHVPACIVADADRLRHVLLSLLTDAIETISASAVWLFVDYQGGRMRVVVNDSRHIKAGPEQGIWPTLMPKPIDSIRAEPGGLDVRRILIDLMGGEFTAGRGESGGWCWQLEFGAAVDSAPVAAGAGVEAFRNRGADVR